MFLLPFASLWVTVSEDKVDFVGCSALVGTKHDCEWGLLVSECRLRERRAHLVGVFLTGSKTVSIIRLGQELDVGTTTFETFL